jgi:hypothetical protein
VSQGGPETPPIRDDAVVPPDKGKSQVGGVTGPTGSARLEKLTAVNFQDYSMKTTRAKRCQRGALRLLKYCVIGLESRVGVNPDLHLCMVPRVVIFEGTSGGLPVAARQCQWSGGAKPEGQCGGSASNGRGPRLTGGRGNAPAGGRQARPGTLWRPGRRRVTSETKKMGGEQSPPIHSAAMYFSPLLLVGSLRQGRGSHSPFGNGGLQITQHLGGNTPYPFAGDFSRFLQAHLNHPPSYSYPHSSTAMWLVVDSFRHGIAAFPKPWS